MGERKKERETCIYKEKKTVKRKDREQKIEIRNQDIVSIEGRNREIDTDSQKDIEIKRKRKIGEREKER
jgi:hypothetical protein